MRRLTTLAAGVAAATAAAAAGAAIWVRRRPGGSTPAASDTPDAPGAADGRVETLQSIRGIGAVSEGRLRALGVTTVAQIAAWSDQDVESVAAQIKVSPERIRREDWAGQARAATKP